MSSHELQQGLRIGEERTARVLQREQEHSHLSRQISLKRDAVNRYFLSFNFLFSDCPKSFPFQFIHMVKGYFIGAVDQCLCEG